MEATNAAARKAQVALVSIIASGGLALAKLVVGLMTGSLSILSEAAHSLIDLGATCITWFAVRFSDQPADDDHHFGHAKMEGIAALAETVLLFLVAGIIAREAVHQLLEPGSVSVEITAAAIIVMLVSIVVDWYRARALKKVARETGSAALEADALHFTSDMVSSAVVLVGLGAVWLGFPMGDALAALGVSCFVAYAGYGLARRTIDSLIDAAPAGVADRIREALLALPKVVGVDQVRVRPVGAIIHVEAVIHIGRSQPREMVTRTLAAANAEIDSLFPGADSLIRVDQVPLDEETIVERIRSIAAHRGQLVTSVAVDLVGDRTSIGLTLELPGDLTLDDAHRQSIELEEMIRSELGEEMEIDTHLEPMIEWIGAAEDLENRRAEPIRREMEQIAAAIDLIDDVHDFRIRSSTNGLLITCHCHCPPEASLENVHAAIAQLEARALDRIPGARRVIIHAEPRNLAALH
jgi:cation diffusion facilitator family transporter